jgi:hypothetical protein
MEGEETIDWFSTLLQEHRVSFRERPGPEIENTVRKRNKFESKKWEDRWDS